MTFVFIVWIFGTIWAFFGGIISGSAGWVVLSLISAIAFAIYVNHMLKQPGAKDAFQQGYSGQANNTVADDMQTENKNDDDTNENNSSKPSGSTKKSKTESNIYDIESIQGIKSIPIPDYKPIAVLQSPTENIEYVLQRKATEYKKDGRMDLAIECLRKSNEIMPHSNFTWSDKDYLRLVSYLQKDGQLEEAKKVENELRENLPLVFDKDLRKKKRFDDLLKQARSVRSDIIGCTTHSPCCALCSIYQGRWYSVSGKDKRFPILPDFIRKTGQIHDGCLHSFFVIVVGMEDKSTIDKMRILSNRPFEGDYRTPEEIAQYENRKKEEEISNQKVKEYEMILEKIPTVAPKSFSGYSRMKNSNSKNFQKLKKAAQEAGIEIL